MKELFDREHMREFIAETAWNLRKAYAEKDTQEFNYQVRKFTAYYLLGFLSENAYHRVMQMYYEMK